MADEMREDAQEKLLAQVMRYCPTVRQVIERDGQRTLDDYLDKKVFAGNAGSCMEPDAEDVEGFESFIERYKAGLPIERAAINTMKL